MKRVPPKFEVVWIAVAIAWLSWPGVAWATTQCPPEFGKKSELFMAAGWCVLGFFVLLGLALPVWAVRATRRQRWPARLLWFLLAVFGLLAIWLCGLAVFVAQFALAC